MAAFQDIGYQIQQEFVFVIRFEGAVCKTAGSYSDQQD